jgi:hypothetical protein
LSIELVDAGLGLDGKAPLHDGDIYPIRAGLVAGYWLALGARIRPAGDAAAGGTKFSIRHVARWGCVAAFGADSATMTATVKPDPDGWWYFPYVATQLPTTQPSTWCGRCAQVGVEVTDLATGARGVTAVGLQLTYPDAASPTTP